MFTQPVPTGALHEGDRGDGMDNIAIKWLMTLIFVERVSPEKASGQRGREFLSLLSAVGENIYDRLFDGKAIWV